METTLSSKGQVVVPNAIRRKLNLRPGDHLGVALEEGRIVLTPLAQRRYKVELTTDPETGLPVLAAEPGAPMLTSEQVAEYMADFP